MTTGKAGRAIDGALDRLLWHRKQAAKQDAVRAELEWLVRYLVLGSTTLVDAPLSDRLHWLSEVRAAVEAAGITDMDEAHVTEPTS